MKIFKNVAILLFLVTACSSFAAAQEAVKIDDVVKYIGYEYELGVLDILLVTMQNNPGSRGVIVLHGTECDPIFPYRHKKMVLNHLAFRSAGGMAMTDKVEIVLGENEKERRMELWMIPEGSEKSFDGKPWDFRLPKLKRPLLVHDDGWIDGIGYGGSTRSLEFFSKFLLANDLRGRIIIKDSSFSKYEKRKKAITAELVKKLGVPQANLEFGFIQGDEKNVEHWLMDR